MRTVLDKAAASSLSVTYTVSPIIAIRSMLPYRVRQYIVRNYGISGYELAEPQAGTEDRRIVTWHFCSGIRSLCVEYYCNIVYIPDIHTTCSTADHPGGSV